MHRHVCAHIRARSCCAVSCSPCTFLGTHGSQERLVSVNKLSKVSHSCKSGLYCSEIILCGLQCSGWGFGFRVPQCPPVPRGQGRRSVPAEEGQRETGHSVQGPQRRPGHGHLQPEGELHPGVCVMMVNSDVTARIHPTGLKTAFFLVSSSQNTIISKKNYWVKELNQYQLSLHLCHLSANKHEFNWNYSKWGSDSTGNQSSNSANAPPLNLTSWIHANIKLDTVILTWPSGIRASLKWRSW